MTKKLFTDLLIFLSLIIFSSMHMLQNKTYSCPMKNSIIEEFTHRKFSLADPASGSRIISYSDSLVYPTLSGTVLNIVITSQNTKSLIISHNDSILSVYSFLDTIFIGINDTVDSKNPIGIAQKNEDKWQIRFAIWNKTVSLNTDSILKCDN